MRQTNPQPASQAAPRFARYLGEHDAMLLDRLAPAVFVILWSTGWIAAKYGSLHADPLTFLSVRYAGAAVVFAIFCVAANVRWPSTWAGFLHGFASGVLLHGIYLGGVWWAIAHGVPASLSGLIAALQPLLTAMSAPFLVGEKLLPAQKAGIGLGFIGLLIAILPGLLVLDANAVNAAIVPLLVNIAAMLSVTLGTIYQKRFLVTGDLRAAATLQYLGAFAFTLPFAWLLEPMHIEWTGETIATLAWSIGPLSAGAILLLLHLIRRGQVSRAASLIYLVPPAVAVEALILFGEPLSTAMMIGTVVVVTGVYLANRKSRYPA